MNTFLIYFYLVKVSYLRLLKLLIIGFQLLLISSNSFAVSRNKYEIKIEFEDFEKYYQYHDFTGKIVRVNEKNSTEKEEIHNIGKGEFPQNGKTFLVYLNKNESIELIFSLTRKKTDDVIESYHKSITADDIEKEGLIKFSLKSEEWKDNSLSTLEFLKFLKGIIFSREQESIANSSVYSKISNLPLGTYIFIDKKNPANIQKFTLPEFKKIQIDSTIPQSMLIMSFNKLIRKESNGSVDASFNQAGIFASIQSTIESADFVEVNMKLDKYYKKYIKNIGAIHFKYLTTNTDSLNNWFLDKIKTINNSQDKNRYELQFTTGYKLIDNLSFTYNSYKKFEAENNIDLKLYSVVTAGAGAKLTRYKSVKDTTIAKEYLIDIESENLTSTLISLADFYKNRETSQNRKELIESQVKYAKSRLSDNLSIFRSNYNDFIAQYKDKGLDDLFSQLQCQNENECIDKVISIANDLKVNDIDHLSELYQANLESKYENIKNQDLKNKTILMNTNLFKNRYFFARDIAIELVAIKGSIEMFNSQLSGNLPLSFKSYLQKYVSTNEYKATNAPLPAYILNVLN